MITINSTIINLGKLIYNLRKNEGLSQEQLAKLINVSRLTIIKIEKGKSTKIDTIFSILKYFDLLEDFNKLITDKKENIDLSNFSLYE